MFSSFQLLLYVSKKRQLLTLITPFFLILHTPVTSKVFALFTCHSIGGPGKMLRSMDLNQKESFGFLKDDYGAFCLDIESSPEIILFYIVAFLFLVVVTVGFPCQLAAYMYIRKEKLYTYEVWSHIGFLYERFIKGCEFTDLHILMYKTLMCAGIIFLQTWPAMQRSVATAIAVSYLTWYAYIQPMKNPLVTKITMFGIGATVFFYVSTSIFVAGNETQPFVKAIFTYALICVAFGLLIGGILAVYFSIKLAATTMSKQSGQQSKATTVVPTNVKATQKKSVIL